MRPTAATYDKAYTVQMKRQARHLELGPDMAREMVRVCPGMGTVGLAH